MSSISDPISNPSTISSPTMSYTNETAGATGTPSNDTTYTKAEIESLRSKIQEAEDFVKQGALDKGYIIATGILAKPNIPPALTVCCHVVLGTAIPGQLAIDHIHEAVQLASEYMEEDIFKAFAAQCTTMIEEKEKAMKEANNEKMARMSQKSKGSGKNKGSKK